jgi:hypothetical protein
MLKHLQKFFNPAASAEVHKEVEMTKPQQTDLAAPELAAKLASSMEALASQAEALKAVTEKLTEMSALYEVAQAALQASDAAKEQLVVDAMQVRLAARKEAIVASIGTAKADALLAATDALDDYAFNAVVSAMANSFETEASSALFSEVGVAVKTDPSAVVTEPEESKESKLLKAKYNKSK